ncbi:MAG TPA: hypothetical protein VFN61_01810 [Acidimicrobiales bacterium]|nr:hypothetical protein [Acidimicrobiales bacterium]
MHEWLVLLLTFLVAPVALVAGAVAVVANHLQRANRLLPGRKFRDAPLRWLWSPSIPAMMHRRLRLACQLASSIAPPSPARRRWARTAKTASVDAIAGLAGDVVKEAMSVDQHVFAASCMPRGLGKARALDDLELQVRAVEDAARRVHQLAARRNSLSLGHGTGDLNLQQRIKAMEEAFGELAPPPG